MYCICVCRRQSDTLHIKRQYRITDYLFSGICICAVKPMKKNPESCPPRVRMVLPGEGRGEGCVIEGDRGPVFGSD